MLSPDHAASAWLQATYGGLVELAAAEPIYETVTSWLMSCRTAPQPGYPHTPMLASSIVVPKEGGSPFHPAPGSPLADLEPAPPQEAAHRVHNQSRRINARGCLIALHSAINGSPSAPLPWRPSDEAPGWWARLSRRYFPEFERVGVNNWDDVVRALGEPGPDTRGVVWLRREIGGHEATGNLLYAHNNEGQVVLLDGLTSSLAKLETALVRDVVLLRALPGAQAPRRYAWEREAHDFATAVTKARLWLDDAYHGQVDLAAPNARDETQRAWVFSCNSRRFLSDGHWQDAMLDATLVVPKDHTAPFGLPNSAPWDWLVRWETGETPGTANLPSPPPPGRASWFRPTLADLGQVMSVSDHVDWQSAMEAITALPVGARALVWIRRTDGRGREAVGQLVNAVRLETGAVVLDGSSDAPMSFDPAGVHRLHVIRYR
ncbi:YrhB domain-containing protein [Streptomyces sp. NPDC003236]